MTLSRSFGIAFTVLAGILGSIPGITAKEPDMGAQPNANDRGIWKSYAPDGLKGEFHNYDPVGLMSGARIHTDCSINYTDPDTRKIYCFNSATSQVYFASWPKTYAARAAEVFSQITKGQPGRDVPTH